MIEFEPAANSLVGRARHNKKIIRNSRFRTHLSLSLSLSLSFSLSASHIFAGDCGSLKDYLFITCSFVTFLCSLSCTPSSSSSSSSTHHSVRYILYNMNYIVYIINEYFFKKAIIFRLGGALIMKREARDLTHAKNKLDKLKFSLKILSSC